MTKTSGITILLLVIVPYLFSCGKSKHDSPPQVPAGALTEKDSGSTVTLHVNETITIALRGNGSTGYLWEVVPGAETILQGGESQYIVDSDAVGSPGTAIFVFKAIAPGNATLQLINHRPWETGVPPVQTFQLTVQAIN